MGKKISKQLTLAVAHEPRSSFTALTGSRTLSASPWGWARSLCALSGGFGAVFRDADDRVGQPRIASGEPPMQLDSGLDTSFVPVERRGSGLRSSFRRNLLRRRTMLWRHQDNRPLSKVGGEETLPPGRFYMLPRGLKPEKLNLWVCGMSWPPAHRAT